MTEPVSVEPTVSVAPPPKPRLFSPVAVGWATFLGSPIAGGLLMGMNYRRWGQKNKLWSSLVLGALALVGAGVLAYLLPDWIPWQGLTVAQAFAANAIAKSAQGRRIDEHRFSGGPMISNWWAAGLGLGIGIVIAVVYFGALFLFFGNLNALLDLQHSVDLGNEQEIYYSRGASRESAQKLGEVLKGAGFFSGKHPATVLLTGTGASQEVGFVLGEGRWDDEEIISAFKAIGEVIGQTLGTPLTIRLLDENVKEHRRIHIESPPPSTGPV